MDFIFLHFIALFNYSFHECVAMSMKGLKWMVLNCYRFVCQIIIYNNNNNNNNIEFMFLQTQSTLQFNYIKTLYYSVRHLFHFAKKIKNKNLQICKIYYSYDYY